MLLADIQPDFYCFCYRSNWYTHTWCNKQTWSCAGTNLMDSRYHMVWILLWQWIWRGPVSCHWGLGFKRGDSQYRRSYVLCHGTTYDRKHGVLCICNRKRSDRNDQHRCCWNWVYCNPRWLFANKRACGSYERRGTLYAIRHVCPRGVRHSRCGWVCRWNAPFRLPNDTRGMGRYRHFILQFDVTKYWDQQFGNQLFMLYGKCNTW